MYVGVLLWAIPARQDETRQGNASHWVSQTRQEGCHLVLKNTIFHHLLSYQFTIYLQWHVFLTEIIKNAAVWCVATADILDLTGLYRRVLAIINSYYFSSHLILHHQCTASYCIMLLMCCIILHPTALYLVLFDSYWFANNLQNLYIPSL